MKLYLFLLSIIIFASLTNCSKDNSPTLPPNVESKKDSIIIRIKLNEIQKDSLNTSVNTAINISLLDSNYTIITTDSGLAQLKIEVDSISKYPYIINIEINKTNYKFIDTTLYFNLSLKNKIFSTDLTLHLKTYVIYYPLHIGDYWEYGEFTSNYDGVLNSSKYYSYFVEKDTSINNIVYKKVICKHIPENIIIKISYERVDTLNGKAFLLVDNKELLIDDFDATLNQWNNLSIIGLKNISSSKIAYVKLKNLDVTINGKTKLYFTTEKNMNDEYELTEKWGFMYYSSQGLGHDFGWVCLFAKICKCKW
ncbi:MAG: hypothetical protein IPK06_06185 [Ignavibacteriae bacterium]|nr:hypothetical protein [Ignavibacteriota bacterium]